MRLAFFRSSEDPSENPLLVSREPVISDYGHLVHSPLDLRSHYSEPAVSSPFDKLQAHGSHSGNTSIRHEVILSPINQHTSQHRLTLAELQAPLKLQSSARHRLSFLTCNEGFKAQVKPEETLLSRLHATRSLNRLQDQTNPDPVLLMGRIFRVSFGVGDRLYVPGMCYHNPVVIKPTERLAAARFEPEKSATSRIQFVSGIQLIHVASVPILSESPTARRYIKDPVYTITQHCQKIRFTSQSICIPSTETASSVAHAIFLCKCLAHNFKLAADDNKLTAQIRSKYAYNHQVSDLNGYIETEKKKFIKKNGAFVGTLVVLVLQ